MREVSDFSVKNMNKNQIDTKYKKIFQNCFRSFAKSGRKNKSLEPWIGIISFPGADYRFLRSRELPLFPRHQELPAEIPAVELRKPVVDPPPEELTHVAVLARIGRDGEAHDDPRAQHGLKPRRGTFRKMKYENTLRK